MVILGTPTQGTIATDTVSSILGVMEHERHGSTVRVQWKPWSCTFLPQARTQLVQHAMLQQATHLLFIDGDMVFPPDSLERLLAHRLSVVGANYRRRTSLEHRFTATRKQHEVTSVGRTGIEPVDYVGLGVCLIDLTLFRLSCVAEWFPGSLFVGEDAAFCAFVHRQGHMCWIDHDLSQQVQHLSTLPLGVHCDS